MWKKKIGKGNVNGRFYEVHTLVNEVNGEEIEKKIKIIRVDTSRWNSIIETPEYDGTDDIKEYFENEKRMRKGFPDDMERINKQMEQEDKELGINKPKKVKDFFKWIMTGIPAIVVLGCIGVAITGIVVLIITIGRYIK